MTFNYLLSSIESLLEGSDLKARAGAGRPDFRAYRLGCARRLLLMAAEVKRQREEISGGETMAVRLTT
jgi:hypothetical protein